MASEDRNIHPARDQDITSTIGREDRTRGDLAIGGGLQVAGIVRGKIESLNGDTTLIVAAGGRVEGTVAVARARIEGVFTGTLTVTGHVEITDTAVVEADIEYGTLRVHSGARIGGRVHCHHGGSLDHD